MTYTRLSWPRLPTVAQKNRLERGAPIRPYRNGRDLTSRSRDAWVNDCYGLTAQEVRDRYLKLYQWLTERVKPERDVNTDKDLREKWWLHRRNNEDMRRSLAGLDRYIVTVHAIWALAAGGRLGVGNDPRYNKTRCFETFPFPDMKEVQAQEIGDLAERIDSHRLIGSRSELKRRTHSARSTVLCC